MLPHNIHITDYCDDVSPYVLLIRYCMSPTHTTDLSNFFLNCLTAVCRMLTIVKSRSYASLIDKLHEWKTEIISAVFVGLFETDTEEKISPLLLGDRVQSTDVPTLSLSATLTRSTRRTAPADRTARRKFQATGQPVSRTQASNAMTSRLPRYEAKCVQRRCFQWGSVPLRSDIKGTDGATPCQYIDRHER